MVCVPVKGPMRLGAGAACQATYTVRAKMEAFLQCLLQSISMYVYTYAFFV